MTERWRPALERYLAYARAFGQPECPRVQEAELVHLRGRARELGLELVPELFDFLRVVNGTSLSAVRLYGANIAEDDVLGRFDFGYANEIIEERGSDTIYGEWQDDFLVREHRSGRFERRSKVTADVLASYDSLADMLTAVFEEACSALDARHGSPERISG
ncbi:MAG: hypothetical protein OXU20_15675 [Myxococcales bacterium]|nr:hypothetical protein [Myxococcales bacterium]